VVGEEERKGKPCHLVGKKGKKGAPPFPSPRGVREAGGERKGTDFIVRKEQETTSPGNRRVKESGGRKREISGMSERERVKVLISPGSVKGAPK